MAVTFDVEDRWRLAWSVVEREAGEAHIDSDARLSPGATRCAEGVVESIDARHLLELGSGASTLRLAALCRDGSRSLDSVDHDRHYFAVTQDQLNTAGLSDVTRLHHAPIAPLMRPTSSRNSCNASGPHATVVGQNAVTPNRGSARAICDTTLPPSNVSCPSTP